ncbi:MAG TPA: phosphatase PAP2 family protein [Polyangia bacterium]|jgi:undecaprenyl-diphosphatase
MDLVQSEAPESWMARRVARLHLLDGRALGWVARRRPPWAVRAMRMVTRTGDPPLVVGALAGGILLRPGRASVLVAAATSLAFGLFSAAKRLFGRARPTAALLAAPDEFSLPSGHATIAWAIAVTVSAVAPRAAPLVCTWAAAVSASRVVLGVHYPFDVVAGAVLGTATAAGCIVAADALRPADELA